MRHCRPTHAKARRKGAVLLLLLVIGAVVATLGTGMLELGYQTRVRATRTTEDIAARVAADAGLTRAIHTLYTQFADGSLNPDALPSETNAALANFEGTYTYTVTKDASGQYILTSTGSYQGAQRTVQAVLDTGGMTYNHALFAQGRLTLHNSATVDEYNSQPGGDPLTIGTNSTDPDEVVLKNSSYINGDIVVGAGGDPSVVIDNSGGTYGSAYAHATVQPLAAVVVPEALASGGSLGRINNNRTISSSGKYSKINLGNSEKLTINGNVELYITGNVKLGNSAEIQINEGCSLTLYVDGTVEGKNSSGFNNLTEDPLKLKIMGTETCEEVILNNSSEAYAIIYAPQAETVLHNSVTVWGSIMADSCELKNGATLFYDSSLRTHSEASAATLDFTGWREY